MILKSNIIKHFSGGVNAISLFFVHETLATQNTINSGV